VFAKEKERDPVIHQLSTREQCFAPGHGACGHLTDSFIGFHTHHAVRLTLETIIIDLLMANTPVNTLKRSDDPNMRLLGRIPMDHV